MRLANLTLCAAVALRLAAQSPPDGAKLEFEVASVKPVKATGSPREASMDRLFAMMQPGSIPMPSPGRVHIESRSLRQLIATAYRVRLDRVSGPSWLEEARFDIEAKLPEGTKPAQANEMLQALLSERFGLEFHRETREFSGFALVVGKRGAKLEEYVPPARQLTPEEMKEAMAKQAEERMKAANRASSDVTGPRRVRSAWSGGFTMPQLAERLTSIVEAPVSDQTGLSGRYKLAFETWQATDDDPGQNIHQAIGQLGLELTRQKVPVEILVIDQISRKPTGN